MVALQCVLLALVSLAGLTAAIIPGLLLGGPLGQSGQSPLLSSLLNGNPTSRRAGLGTTGGHLGPGGILGSLLGRMQLAGMPLGGMPLGGMHPGLGSVGGDTGNSPTSTSDAASSSMGDGGDRSASPSTGGSSRGPSNVDDSSEEETRTRSKATPPRVEKSSSGENHKKRRQGGKGSRGSKRRKDSSEEADDTPKKSSSRRSKSRKASSEESEEKSRKSRKRRSSEGRIRDKRSLVDEFGLMGIKGAHQAADNVPDHVKLVHCGRHEVPNPGGIQDHFCHPEATWDTLLRMRPDCVCQQGYLRNSWGECISPAECDHCSDKHHLNMDYHLCESPCPIVCNQPIDENCANMCYKECACRPGYIRAYPNGPCISIKECLPGCRGPNQIFSLCSSLCPATCKKPHPKRCPKICAGEGCVCKPGYVVKRWEPLQCVLPENCPGRRRKCPGPNQRYTKCIRRCFPSCFKRRRRYCGHECLGRGCVCKRGYVMLQRRPLVCVRRDQCPSRPKKCPARNQVYMYCKSKCPRTCENPNPRRCGSACEGEGCACRPGYVMKQEDPLICVRRYQCSSELEGLEDFNGVMGVKDTMGAKGATGVKGAMGTKGAIGAKGEMGADGAKGAMGAEGAEVMTVAEGTKGARRKKGSSRRKKIAWEFTPQ